MAQKPSLKFERISSFKDDTLAPSMWKMCSAGWIEDPLSSQRIYVFGSLKTWETPFLVNIIGRMQIRQNFNGGQPTFPEHFHASSFNSTTATITQEFVSEAARKAFSTLSALRRICVSHCTETWRREMPRNARDSRRRWSMLKTRSSFLRMDPYQSYCTNNIAYKYLVNTPP